MRKEIIFAVILGIALGGVILYGTYIANQATSKANLAKSNNQPNAQYANSPSQTPPPLSTAAFALSFPHDNYVSFSDSLKITGSAPANSPIAIISEKDEQIVTASDNGRFEADVTLIGGENEIKLSTLTGNQQETINLTVIYTTSDINLNNQ